MVDTSTTTPPPLPPPGAMQRMSTGAVLRMICRRQLEQFLARLPEVVAGRDPEALHDLRVAVRRTRTVLGEFKASFPAEGRQWLGEELRWLGTVTGPVRDLDVYLEHLAAYARRLPEEDAAGLAPLRQLLLARRRVERRRLLRGLKSARLAGLLAGWQRLLCGADASGWPPAAALPGDEAARRRTWKLYRRFLRQGAAIAGDSTDEHLHRLRITGKKLRYLVEFFRDLHPATEIAVLVKAMKGIQDHLGALQDLSVQRQALAGSREQLAATGCLTPATARAISLLAEILHREQLTVRRQIPERFRIFTRGRGRRGLIRLYAPQRRPSAKS